MAENRSTGNAWILKGFISAFAVCTVTATVFYLTVVTMYKGSALRVFAMAFGAVGFILSIICIAWLINHYVSEVLECTHIQFALKTWLLCNPRLNVDSASENLEGYNCLPPVYDKAYACDSGISNDLQNCEQSAGSVKDNRGTSDTTLELDTPETNWNAIPNYLIPKVSGINDRGDGNLQLENCHGKEIDCKCKVNTQLKTDCKCEEVNSDINDCKGDMNEQVVSSSKGDMNAQLVNDCKDQAVQINDYDGEPGPHLIDDYQGEVSVQLIADCQCERIAQLVHDNQDETSAQLIHDWNDQSKIQLNEESVPPSQNSIPKQNAVGVSTMLESQRPQSNELQKEPSSFLKNSKGFESPASVCSPHHIQNKGNLFTTNINCDGTARNELPKPRGNNDDSSSSVIQIVNRKGIVGHILRFLKLNRNRSANKRRNIPSGLENRNPFEVKLDAFVLFPSLDESPLPTPAITKQTVTDDTESSTAACWIEHPQGVGKFRSTQEKMRTKKRKFSKVLVGPVNSLFKNKENNSSRVRHQRHFSRGATFGSGVFNSEDSVYDSLTSMSSPEAHGRTFSSMLSITDHVNSESSMVSNMNLFRIFNRRAYMSSSSLASSYF